MFGTLWARGLEEYDALKGLDWRWLAIDGAMTKAPLGGERTGKNPTDRGKLGAKRSLLTEANGGPVGRAVEGANRHDKKVAEATLESSPVDRPEPTEEEPQGISPIQANYIAAPVLRRTGRRRDLAVQHEGGRPGRLRQPGGGGAGRPTGRDGLTADPRSREDRRR